MSIEEMVKAYKEIAQKIEELEEQKKALSSQILPMIPTEVKSVRVADFQVRRCSRLSIKTSLESAKTFNAVQLKEVVDKDKIKSLYEQGYPVPDVTQIEYIQVSKILEKVQ
jgi:hypothetical protein